MKTKKEKPLFTKKDLEITPYDTAEYLKNDETIAAYLNASLEDFDYDVFLEAIGNVVRAKGINQLAQETGLARQALYRTFNPGKKPQFDTILKLAKALGLNLNFTLEANAKVATAKKRHKATA